MGALLPPSGELCISMFLQPSSCIFLPEVLAVLGG